MKYDVYIGTYSVDKSQGIYQGELDTDARILEVKTAYPEHIENPSFLAVAGNRLYAVNELSAGGAVAAYERDEKSGRLKFLSRYETEGAGMCHVTVWPDRRHISLANYNSGSLVVCGLDGEGLPKETTAFIRHEGVGYDAGGRQEGPHVHSTVVSADNRFLYAADLGLDQLFCYQIEDGALKLSDSAHQVRVPAGEGPRHFVFTPDGRYLYLVTEMGNRLHVMRRDEESGGYISIQTLSTLPEKAKEGNTAADIHFSADLQYLYVSNRGEDCITGYLLDKGSGEAVCIGFFPAYGRGPRNFCITPDDRYMLIANQFSDNLVLCGRDPKTGVIGEKLCELNIPQPVFVTTIV